MKLSELADQVQEEFYFLEDLMKVYHPILYSLEEDKDIRTQMEQDIKVAFAHLPDTCKNLIDSLETLWDHCKVREDLKDTIP